MSARVLLADDDASLRLVLSQALAKEGYQVRATASLPTMAKWVKDGEGDVVVSDVYLGEDVLFDALPGLRAARPDLPVIVMSGQSTVLTALSAAGGGAYEYLPKPFDLDDLTAAIKRALAVKTGGRARPGQKAAEEDERMPIIGRSRAMQEVYRVIARVAATDLTVLIEGEHGAGKERVARAVHAYSARKARPIITVSLAGADATQTESQLFGPEGAFAQAKGGALLLDGVDDASPAVQSLLLRALDTIKPGEGVRVLATAARNLADLAARGLYRQDLLYRLNVVVIRLPPLRERMDDIADLARAFLVRAKLDGLPEKSLDPSALELLKTHDWPGNVRELENLLRRAAVLRPEAVITAREIAHELAAARVTAVVGEEPSDGLEAALRARLRAELAHGQEPDPGLYDRLLADMERPMIEFTLEATKGNQIRAAAILGINRNTLRKKIQTLGIRTGRDG